MRSPVPSRNGKRLFAEALIEGTELVRYDAASRAFKPFLEGISADGLAFSRDRSWVAYTSYPERSLWRCRADGSDRRQLTDASTKALLPSLSPDERTIAFMAQVPGKPWQIYLLAAEGGDAKPVTSSDEDQANPTWSPEGRSIAFAGAPWSKGWDPKTTSIHIIDLQSSRIRTLPGSEGLWSPRWSPVGNWLIAETTDSKQLLLYSFSSRQWRKLADAGRKTIGFSSWSHDSHFIYFNLVSPTENGIYRVGVNGKSPELVLPLDSLRLKETHGAWFTLTPEDQPLLLRDTSAEEIYALTLNYR